MEYWPENIEKLKTLLVKVLPMTSLRTDKAISLILFLKSGCALLYLEGSGNDGSKE